MDQLDISRYSTNAAESNRTSDSVKRHVICCPRPSYENEGKVTVWDLNQGGMKTAYPKGPQLPVKTRYICSNCGHTKYI